MYIDIYKTALKIRFKILLVLKIELMKKHDN